jgi:hypothetical protein
MLTIDNKNEIHLTRGDTAFIKTIPEVENDEHPGKYELYEFQDGDVVVFRMAINSKTVFEKECFIDLEENKATLTLLPSDTEELEPRTYYYCFELITAGGAHFTYIENARFTLGKELEKRAEE